MNNKWAFLRFAVNGYITVFTCCPVTIDTVFHGPDINLRLERNVSVRTVELRIENSNTSKSLLAIVSPLCSSILNIIVRALHPRNTNARKRLFRRQSGLKNLKHVNLSGRASYYRQLLSRASKRACCQQSRKRFRRTCGIPVFFLQNPTSFSDR